MPPIVYRCPSCGSPLQVGSRLIVTCAYCDVEVHLQDVEQRRWAQQFGALQRRIQDGKALAESLQPEIDTASEAFEDAVATGRMIDALLQLQRMLRLHVAGPQVMVPDFDYEAEVVQPAVQSFAEEHGIELPPV